MNHCRCLLLQVFALVCMRYAKDAIVLAPPQVIVDPDGGGQDVRRFSTRQGCLVEKS